MNPETLGKTRDLREFTYELPPKLIAQYPLKQRDQARLMIVHRSSGKIEHDVFAHLSRYLPDQSHLVLNDSKVIPARILGRRATGARVEILLLKKTAEPGCYEALLRPRHRLKSGEKIFLNGGSVSVEIKDKDQGLVCFNRKNTAALLNKIGHMPLPPYIKREDTSEDFTDYQTVYAKRQGSVAAPTAGLHFTRELLVELKAAGHTLTPVTLHVNQATFKPVKTPDITQHPMHEEEYAVSKRSWTSIHRAKTRGGKIVAVGTTSCRVLETLGCGAGLKGGTDIFIYPGHTFRMTDILITNFHLPCTTLLMLVHAFGGMELMRRAYQEAIAREYRFYSYGDGMMIL